MRNTGNVYEICGLDSPRLRFNSGYHDARSDWDRGLPRELLPDGKLTDHDLRHVSAGYDPYYFHGYRLGLNSTAETSTAAWLDWLASLTEKECFQVELQILCAEFALQGTPFSEAALWRAVEMAQLALKA